MDVTVALSEDVTDDGEAYNYKVKANMDEYNLNLETDFPRVFCRSSPTKETTVVEFIL